MTLISAGTLSIAVELIGEISRLIVSAVEENDLSKIERVTDVLPAGHPLKLKVKLACEEEKTRQALEGQE